MPVGDRQSRFIGPWPDGLITRHEGSYDVAETYLADCLNLDVTDYGVLVQRPGFIRFHDAWGDGWPVSFTNYRYFRLLGSWPTASGAGNLRLYLSILEFRGGNWQEDVYFTDDPTTGSPTLLFSNNHGASEPPQADMFGQAVLYNGKIYFIRITQAAAGAFPNNAKMDNGDTTGATVTAISSANTRFGFYAFIMQDRLFISDKSGSTVDYSKATNMEEFDAPDGGFFNINPNDAQEITAIVVLEDIVYFFKEDSTWAFTFNTDPAVDGFLRQVNKNFGAFDATNKGSEIYVVNRHGVFRFVDGDFISIAENIRTIMDAPDSWGSDVTITIVENRLMIGNIFELGDYTTIAMNLNTGAWTKYDPVDNVIAPTSKRSYVVAASPEGGGKAFHVWGDYSTNVVEDAIDSQAGFFAMMRIGGDISDPDNRTRDQDRVGAVWVPHYRLVTVPLALDDPSRWKKLYRWRFDIEQADEDNDDAFVQLSVREGDPFVSDDSQTLGAFPDFYTDFFDSVVTEQRRFKILQFGVDKAVNQTGAGVTDTTTFRVRGLAMEYQVRGLIRT